MELLAKMWAGVAPLLPTAGVAATLLLALWVVSRLLRRRAEAARMRFGDQILMLALSLLALLVVVLALPVSDALRGQILSLLGILISAALALSSTTLLGNAMAGIMLRAVGSFRSGDFVRVGEHYGRVSERGLFHTELQTEDRDLTTLPNLYLVTHPVTVSHATGTIVSATVSLGYDVPRRRIKELLLQAAEQAGLQEPFVQILDLGDFSVTYRIAGLLTEVKHVLTTRSNLRAKMLDALHGAGVEIVSPNFMNQRQLDPAARFVPRQAGPQPEDGAEAVPESLVFDKADQAESVEKLREKHGLLGAEVDAARALLKKATDTEEKEKLARQVEGLERRRNLLAEAIAAREAELHK